MESLKSLFLQPRLKFSAKKICLSITQMQFKPLEKLTELDQPRNVLTMVNNSEYSALWVKWQTNLKELLIRKLKPI
jgi:hypothetical protein